MRAAGTSTAVLDDAPVTLDAGTNTIIYAIGSLSGGTFTVAAQVLARPPLLSPRRARVQRTRQHRRPGQ